jgi:hypothetical protein
MQLESDVDFLKVVGDGSRKIASGAEKPSLAHDMATAGKHGDLPERPGFGFGFVGNDGGTPNGYLFGGTDQFGSYCEEGRIDRERVVVEVGDPWRFGLGVQSIASASRTDERW